MKNKSISGMTWALLIVYVYMCTSMLVYSAPPGGEDFLKVVNALTPVLAGLFATVCAGLVWRRVPDEERNIWFWLCVGIGEWTVVEAILAYNALTSDTLRFTVASTGGLGLIRLLGYLPIGIGMSHKMTRSLTQITWRRLVWAVIGGLVLPSILLLAFTLPVLFNNERGPGFSLIAIVLALYPALDISFSTGGFLSVPKKRDGWWHPWFLIGGAWVLWLYADAWYWVLRQLAAYRLGLPGAIRVDIPYTLAYIVLGLCCIQTFPLMSDSERRDTKA